MLLLCRVKSAVQKILIIVPWYAPLSHPRAHRWTAIAEYWVVQGHEVHVVCARQKQEPVAEIRNGVHVHRVGYDALKSIFFQRINAQHQRHQPGKVPAQPGFVMGLLMNVYRVFLQKVIFPDEAWIWQRPAQKTADELLQNIHFDVLISVSLPFSSHCVALKIKRNKPGLRWIADMGDPFAGQSALFNYYPKWSRSIEQAVLRTADQVSVTTEATRWLLAMASPDVDANKIAVIPPLWTPAVSSELAPFVSADEAHIHIGYFGTLYKGVRTAGTLLRLLVLSRQLRPELYARLQVHLFGDLPADMLPALQAEPAIRLHGMIGRAEVPAQMQVMHALLHIGNKSSTQLPSKIADYLAAQKPVIHLSECDPDPFLSSWGLRPGLWLVNAYTEPLEMAGWFEALEQCRSFRLSAPHDVSAFGIARIAAAYEAVSK